MWKYANINIYTYFTKKNAKVANLPPEEDEEVEVEDSKKNNNTPKKKDSKKNK